MLLESYLEQQNMARHFNPLLSKLMFDKTPFDLGIIIFFIFGVTF